MGQQGHCNILFYSERILKNIFEISKDQAIIGRPLVYDRIISSPHSRYCACLQTRVFMRNPLSMAIFSLNKLPSWSEYILSKVLVVIRLLVMDLQLRPGSHAIC